jgi:predicted acylesterase/phospholipase RssA
MQIAAAPSGKKFEEEKPWLKFQEFLGKSVWAGPAGVSAEAVRRGFDGKVGLALSGGGFRASLFHIGVLARLAELDVLRRVEVISCVSGGSIVGAHYYLEVRNLLRRKRDEEITPQDYVEIVGRVAERFLAGVQRNIRVRVAASFAANLKMVFKLGYTRTLRLGELYEEELYSLVDDREGAEKKKPRYMHELVIRPLLGGKDGGPQYWEEFAPKLHNWRRRSKAPILVLNAATLNTGHNWQFTATYMGESSAAIHTEIDSVYRLRRKYYKEEPDTPGRPQRVRLGTAVAASSCVPALFEPVVFDDAYTRRDGDGSHPVSVRLVDGGVCDNQGVASLLEQDCNVLLVSDGSGQMEQADLPGTAALAVAGRSNSILQARVRGTQYRELDARQRSSFLRGLMFVHLKKDLDNSPVDWKGCPTYLTIAPPTDTADTTGYGIPKEVQRRLARIRTDLDTFCDQESFALMTSGYLMTKVAYEETFGSPPEGEASPAPGWKFLQVEEVMKNTGNAYRDERAYLDRVLAAGSGLAFKVWKLSPGLKTVSRVAVVLAAVAAVAAVALAVWTLPVWWHASVVSPERLRRAGEAVTFGLIAASVIALVLAALLIYIAGRVVGVTRWVDALASRIVGALLLLVGYPAAKIHLWLFDDLYKKCGGLDRIVRPQESAAAGEAPTPQAAD